LGFPILLSSWHCTKITRST